MMFNDTICAVATGSTTSAVSIIRISGSKSADILLSIFKKKGEALTSETLIPNKLYFGEIVDNNDVIDEVLVSFFKNPHSYTGEDSVEISTHGSPYIRWRLLDLLLHRGCRMAEAGEFTRRAFVNGRFDLAQAEAVADLIASENEAMHRMALCQMRGGFSKMLADLRAQLLNMMSLLELELDFSEEDVEFADRTKLLELLDTTSQHVTKLCMSFRYGNAIKNGIPVAIVGEPNTGKSTLLNTILHDDRAIVSDIAGTTRDTIEETITINGQLFRFIDTAGIRKSDETIEKIGIERSIKKLIEAHIVLGVLDITNDYEAILNAVEIIVSRTDLSRQSVILLLNKSDLLPHVSDDVELNLRKMTDSRIKILPISAKKGLGIDILTSYLTQDELNISKNDVLVSNIRHFEALRDANESIQATATLLRDNMPTDLAAQELRIALHHIGTITGEVTTNEVLGNIFGKFCIGK